MTDKTLFTIGHSDHDLPKFMALLTRHGVNAIADVRSQPYSKFNAQFNRETLAECLGRAGVNYLFLGRELGARRIERESYQGKQARYDLVSRLPAFHEGLGRLRLELASKRVALLCAEKDPITCHRTILVCRHLRSEPINIQHILADGEIETNAHAEDRLLEEVGLPPTHLFCNRAELVEQAYDLQGDRIAYVEADALVMSGGLA